jgi:hypothetical protein
MHMITRRLPLSIRVSPVRPKDGRAMRIETVVNAPRDLGCNARLPNLDELQAKGRAANRRILDAERAGQGTVLASPAFERVAHPSADAEGRRTPALRFGDPRVMALAGALCQTLLAATGFTNKNLRVLIAGLLGSSYTPGQMTYDLRRLRLGGLIRRLPHTNRYTLTEDGIRIAVFYTKIYNRLLVPLTAANQPQAPPELRAALAAITRHVDDYADRARLPRRRVKLDTNVHKLATKDAPMSSCVRGGLVEAPGVGVQGAVDDVG